jgi:hypothetical protein
MRTTLQFRTNNPVGDVVINASRQFWLASLGAAVVTRDWAQAEGGSMFRTLVKEGTAVESRTIRLVGDRLEGSFAMANTLWKQARTTVQTTVKQAADSAVTLVQNNLPRSLPKVKLPTMLAAELPKARKRTTGAKRSTKAKPGATKIVKRAKRVAKSATRK